jgi:uncharacterized protein
MAAAGASSQPSGKAASRCVGMPRPVTPADRETARDPAALTAGNLTVKLLPMFTRTLPLPDRSFFLFGPRGTGKTTWLRERLPDAAWFDLVSDRELLSLMRDPGRFSRQVEALPTGSWVVVDEVQRLPALLNEVHDLIARWPGRYRFSLTGSSARKLKRGGADLLPSRVVNRKFFPLTSAEIGFDFDLDDRLRFGDLPAVRSESSKRNRVDLLEAYVENYVTQEIRIEASVKRLDSFVRFLEVAALMNGQIANVSSLSRDAAVSRQTVQGYFEVLADTLLGSWLPAWRPRAKVKEVGHPKFFVFDTGVARALAGRLRDPLDSAERGPLLETLVLHELRAWLNLSGSGGSLSYWRTPSGSEVDFVWTRGKHAVGIEVKSSTRWRDGDGDALNGLVGDKHVSRAFGIYLGDRRLKDGSIDVHPLATFLERLQAGAVLGT